MTEPINWRHTMKISLLAGFAGVSLLSLSACSVLTTPPSASDGAAAADCMAGEWQLDVDDLEAQVETLLSATTNVDDLDVSGEQSLTFDDDGTVSMRADLDASAEVDGRSLSRVLNATGTGGWEWVEEGSSLKVTDWAWESDPDSEPGDEAELPTFDFADAPAVGVTCSDDTLTLEPEGTPIVGTFTRM
jgi:hypothetical protein